MFIGKHIMQRPPTRIVSLVPSITELLYDLGLENEIIGITRFCIHPAHWHTSKTRIGGTKKLNPDIIRKLNPDLILANKEENVREQVEELALECPVWLTDVGTVNDAMKMIMDIGEITGKSDKAEEMIIRIRERMSSLPEAKNPVPTAYLIWREPYMTVGGDTYIHDMLRLGGFHNVFGNRTRYPSIDIETLAASGCKLVFLSSEPYPFKEKHIAELALRLPGVKVLLADGEMFSWYGSRLLKGLDYIAGLKQSSGL